MDKGFLSISETAKCLGVSIDTLRRWDTDGKFKPAYISAGKHRYYRKIDVDLFMNDVFLMAESWAMANTPVFPASDYYCQFKPVLLNQLERLQSDVRNIPELSQTYSLIVGIAAEIGNNSFDHNLGNWPDIQGIFFGYDMRRRKIALADRGRGILRTLQAVRPSLESHSDALRVAFTEILTGRAPESRGNGLKFVRMNVTKKLVFRSGDAEARIENGSDVLSVVPSPSFVQGCVAMIEF